MAGVDDYYGPSWDVTRRALLEYRRDLGKYLPFKFSFGVDLRCVSIREIELEKALFKYAIMDNADLTRANFTRADFSHASLRYARFEGCDLRYAYFNYADLSGADFTGANFAYADMGDANLTGAILINTNIDAALTNYRTVGVQPAPEGDIIGWGRKSGYIVKMLIPSDSPRSCATTRKFRAAWVKVLEIDGGNIESVDHMTLSRGKTAPPIYTTYRVGEITRADYWDPNRWKECSNGIHFFLTKEEAQAWTG